MLTQSRLKELFNYNKETGAFTRIKQVKGKTIKSSVGTYKDGYIQIQIDYKIYKAHRLAWLYVYGEWPINFIDHINGIKDDNRISNLRDVTSSVNLQNKKNAQSNNKTGILGVCFDKSRNKFIASITFNNKQKIIGRFNSAEDAKNAYLNLKRKHHEGCTI